MASLAVRDAKSYVGAFPKFGQPKEVACFSRDAGRTVTFDRASLRNYRVPRLPAVLDEGFEAYVARDSGSDEVAPMEPILKALAQKQIAPAANTFLSYRNNLNKIFLTPYNPKDDWEVGVERRADGAILLHVRETARKKSEEASRDERGQRMCYWGYRFEQLATLTEAEASAHEAAKANGHSNGAGGGGGTNQAAGGYRVPSPSDAGSYDHLFPPGELAFLKSRYADADGGASGVGGSGPDAATAPPPAAALGAVNANEEFCSVVQLSIDKVKVLMAAEIDCVAPTKPVGAAASAPGAPCAAGYVELKTSRLPRSDRETESFERHKLLKFWLQSFLADVPSVIVGFRDDAGNVQQLKTYETKTIHRLVRKGPAGAGYWDPSACFNFGKGVLEWVVQQVAAHPVGAMLVMRYDPMRATISLTPEAEGEEHGGLPSAKRARAE